MTTPAPNSPSTAPAAPKRKKAKKPRRAEEGPVEVSINSLLDILTCVLLFLIKSYSSSTIDLKPSKDLQVPFSTSEVAPDESAAITVTAKDILLNDMPIVRLTDGKLSDGDLSHAGMLIEPLYSKLQEEVARQKKVGRLRKDKDFAGVVTIICDRFVPFSLLTQVMYTAGQAEYAKFKFLTVKVERG